MKLLLAFFMLYGLYVKLSDGNGFWSNLQESDNNTNKLAVELQRCWRNGSKAQLDLLIFYRTNVRITTSSQSLFSGRTSNPSVLEKRTDASLVFSLMP